MAIDRQTGKLIARIAENLPDLDTESTQVLCNDPMGIKHILRALTAPTPNLVDLDQVGIVSETIPQWNARIFRFESQTRIIAMEEGNRVVRLGQLVFANGRCFVSTGQLGIVVGISRPFSEGKSNNVISVHFRGEIRPHDMKFKDLETWDTIKK